MTSSPSGTLIALLRSCAAGDSDGPGGGSDGSGSGVLDGSGAAVPDGSEGPDGSDGSDDDPGGCCCPPDPGGEGIGRCPPRVGSGSPVPAAACPPGPAEAPTETLGSGDSGASRSECASAPLPERARPVPAAVEPSGSLTEPFGRTDCDGAGFPPSSLMLMQPVDVAIVTAVTAAHRTGTDKAGN
ncbi:hypothetical protein ACWCP8_12375 [Streptomyces sp. NPDC002206]